MKIFAIILLTVVAFAGCVDSSEEIVLDVPPPQIGSQYRYESPDGSMLTISITGHGQRYDGLMRPHEVLLMEHVFRPAYLRGEPNTDRVEFVFEEAVDPATGFTVQQVVRCGEMDPDGIRCVENPRSHVYFDHSGLPGAVGAGPWWGDSPVSPLTSLDTSHILSPGTTIQYKFESNDEGCYTAQGDIKNPGGWVHYGRGLPWSIARGPMILCPGTALPIEFTMESPISPFWTTAADPGHRETFTLINHSMGNKPIQTEASSGSWELEGELVPMTGKMPQYPLHTPEPSSPFTLEEAHQVARQEDDLYNTLTSEGSDARVLASSWSYRHSNRDSGALPNVSISGDTGEYSRKINLYNSDVGLHSFEVIKSVGHDPLGRSATEYKVERTRIYDVHSVSNWTLPDVQADISQAFRLGEKLTDQQYDGEPSIVTMDFIRTSNFILVNDVVAAHGNQRGIGHDVILRYSDPSAASSGGFGFTYPMEVIFDGPTGALVRLHQEPGAEPFGP